MSTFCLPDPEHTDVLAEVAKAYFPHLADAGVTVGLLVAHAKVGKDGEVSGHALKLHGLPALAIVRINKLRDRIRGMPDAMIDIDGDAYPGLPDAQRRSLFHHELEHIVVVYDKESGAVKYDDAGRPKLKLRPHEIVIGGFWGTVDAFGADAHESIAYRDVHKGFTQRVFPWG